MELKDFVCRAPFEDFMVFDSETWFCCPDWMELDSPPQIKSHDNLESIWFSDRKRLEGSNGRYSITAAATADLEGFEWSNCGI